MGWEEVAADQAGVISRQQLLALGLTPRQARRWLDSGRWRPVFAGVYATFTGPMPPAARAWAAVLHAGPGAALAGRSALWSFGVLDLPEVVDVFVPHERSARSLPFVRVRRVRNLEAHPARRPPVIRLEVAVLDLADQATSSETVVDVVLRVIQRRLTTADRLNLELTARPRHSRRALLLEVLADASEGVASPLERRYARDVERAHGLPAGARNRLEYRRNGGTRYSDVRYDGCAVVVELDGREAHPSSEAFRDLRRDNETVLSGDRVLRYGWRDVVGRPCEVAAQVAEVLRSAGWAGTPRRCGRCP